MDTTEQFLGDSFATEEKFSHFDFMTMTIARSLSNHNSSKVSIVPNYFRSLL
jgi:hypothetical protein